MKSASVLLPSLALLCASAAVAGSPFDGTWILDTGKSKLAGDTLSYSDAGDGMLKYTDSDSTYTFKTDGTAFTTPMGAERTFTKIGDDSYTATTKRGGTLLATTTLTVSADGKTLVEEAKGTKPNGDGFDNHFTYAKTSAGTGLIGSWKSTKIDLSTPNTFTVQSDDAGGVTLTISDIKATCAAQWNGKPFPATGPTVPEGLTLSVTKTSAHSFQLVQKFKGKTLIIAKYRLAADGKSMTEKGTNGKGQEPFTEVWEKKT